MPIYEYRCSNCGFQKEYIQRMSDAPLTDCPECKQASFSKMVTAAGFQLKGGGWYVTDFKGGNTLGGGSKKSEDKSADGSKSAEPAKPEKAKSDSGGTAGSASASSSSSTAASGDS
jgi:putative FmdB family regulatory protein